MKKSVIYSACTLAVLLLAGCKSSNPVSYVMPTEPPVVSSFAAGATSKLRSVVIWGNDLRTVNAATVWLQQHGVAVYSQGILQAQIAKNSAHDSNLLIIDEGAVLHAANQVKADAVVFADRLGDSRPPMVSVRAVDASSGRVVWSSNARFGSDDQLPSNETLSWLTENALNGAWGINPQQGK